MGVKEGMKEKRGRRLDEGVKDIDFGSFTFFS